MVFERACSLHAQSWNNSSIEGTEYLELVMKPNCVLKVVMV